MIYSLFALLATAAMATLTPNLPRGTQLVQRSANEVCVVPKKLAGGEYSKKDLEMEINLCNLDVNGASANTGICGKTASTNPGVEFFRVPKGMTAAALEAKDCEISADTTQKLKAQDIKANGLPKGATSEKDVDDGAYEAKKLAKYKLSTSCSYTPAILGYYHVSRALGGLNQVPPAVLRTMDIKRHLQVGNETMAKLRASGEASDVIGLTWGSLLKFLNAGASSSKKDVLMTDDFQQSYGALQANPTKEEKYSELYNGGSDQNIRAQNFRDKNVIYSKLKKSASIRDIVSTNWTTENVQLLQQMKNVADMILMDTMLSQEDRFGNVHFTMDYYYMKDGNVKRESKMSAEDVKNLRAVRVKNMMMKDNDCGVNRTNHLKVNKLLAGLAHFNPETYHKLLQLNTSLATEDTRLFFRRETMMNESDFAQFKANVGYAVSTLQTACKKGALKLDLDLDGHFASAKQNTSCE